MPIPPLILPKLCYVYAHAVDFKLTSQLAFGTGPRRSKLIPFNAHLHLLSIGLVLFAVATQPAACPTELEGAVITTQLTTVCGDFKYRRLYSIQHVGRAAGGTVLSSRCTRSLLPSSPLPALLLSVQSTLSLLAHETKYCSRLL